MPIRSYKPTSPGRRFQTVQTFDEITATEPYKPLVEPLTQSGGRNSRGEITSWWRGGGHKRAYRVIDFKRDKRDIPAKDVDGRVRPEPVGADRAGHLRRRREALHPAPGRAEGRRHDRRRRHGGHPAGQRAAAEEHPAGHDGAQRGAEAGQGRADGPQRGRGGAGGGEGRRLRHRQDAVERDPAREPGELRYGRPGGQPRPRERVDRQGRAQPLARQAAARARASP